jgi:hypothetical protein
MKSSIGKYDVEAPVLFNCWKHHKEFIQVQINKTIKGGDKTLQKLPVQLLRIGDSLLDLYTGILNPRNISKLIQNELKERNVFNRQSYEEWIANSGNNYQILYLTDSSFWTLRLGKEIGKYIHIHPGRYSPHTIRIRALTLKTAIVVSAWAKIYKVSPFDISTINHVRTKLLNASPLKSISTKDGLGKVILIL